MSDRRRWWWLVPLCVAAFVVAGVTYVLVVLGVGGSEPSFNGDLDTYLNQYLRYRRTIWPAEMVANLSLGIGAIAFAIMMWIGPLLGVLRADPLGRTSSVLAFTGALIFTVAQLAYLGALSSVLEAYAVDAFDVRELATMTQLIDRTDDFVESLGMILIAAALPGARMESSGGVSAWWRRSTAALSVALVLAVIAAIGRASWGDGILAVTAVVLVPTVALVFGRCLRQAT